MKKVWPERRRSESGLSDGLLFLWPVNFPELFKKQSAHYYMQLQLIITLAIVCCLLLVTTAAAAVGGSFSNLGGVEVSFQKRSPVGVKNFKQSPSWTLKRSNRMVGQARGGGFDSFSTTTTTMPSMSNAAKNGAVENPVLIKKARQSILKNALASWGVFNVLTMLLQSVVRLYPVAVQPFYTKDFETLQWSMYFGWMSFMVYAEGYKGFYKKFSPFVVERAFTIADRPNPLNILLAGPYCMGLFGATRKRMIVSWSLALGVVALVVLVKRLPYPYRAIVDGGVVAGLSFGAASIAWLYVRGLLGYLPGVDPCFPESAEPAASVLLDSDKSK
jgi:hypothetical protein